MGSVGWDLGKVVAPTVSVAGYVAVFGVSGRTVVTELSDDAEIGAELADVATGAFGYETAYVASDPLGNIAGAALIEEHPGFPVKNLATGTQHFRTAQACGSTSYLTPVIYGGDGWLYWMECKDTAGSHFVEDEDVVFYLYRATLDFSTYELVGSQAWPQASWPQDGGAPPARVSHQNSGLQSIFFDGDSFHSLWLMTYTTSWGASHPTTERAVWCSISAAGVGGAVTAVTPDSLWQTDSHAVVGELSGLGKNEPGKFDAGADAVYAYAVGLDRGLAWTPPSITYNLRCPQRFGSEVFFTDRPQSVGAATNARWVRGTDGAHTETLDLPVHPTLGVRPRAVLATEQSS